VRVERRDEARLLTEACASISSIAAKSGEIGREGVGLRDSGGVGGFRFELLFIDSSEGNSDGMIALSVRAGKGGRFTVSYASCAIDGAMLSVGAGRGGRTSLSFVGNTDRAAVASVGALSSPAAGACTGAADGVALAFLPSDFSDLLTVDASVEGGLGWVPGAL
jgi:hypothetical protein